MKCYLDNIKDLYLFFVQTNNKKIVEYAYRALLLHVLPFNLLQNSVSVNVCFLLLRMILFHCLAQLYTVCPIIYSTFIIEYFRSSINVFLSYTTPVLYLYLYFMTCLLISKLVNYVFF